MTVPPTPVVDNEGELLFRLDVPLSHSVGLLDTTPKQGFRSCVSSPIAPSPKTELVRAATFAGTPGDPLGNFALPAQQRRHTLAVPTDKQDGPHRSPSVLSETSKASLGRAAYRRHDGPMPRPRSPCPSPSFLNASSDMLQTEEAVFVFPEPRFIPMSANDIMRYDRNAKGHAMMQVEVYGDPTTSDYSIQEYSVDYPFFEGTPPHGWTAHVHPEGALYYLHDETACFNKTFTEVDICNVTVLADIEQFRRALYDELRRAIFDRMINLGLDDVELVLEPRADDYGVLCSYYFVHRRKRCLFWLEVFDARSILGDCKGVTALSHKRLAIEAQYWKHRDLFPVLGEVDAWLVAEVKDMMLHAACDHLSSTRSTAALSTDELHNYLSIIEKIDVNSTFRCDHTVVIIGHPKPHTLDRNQYLNFHGQPCARLSVDQTVHGWRYRPSTAMIILAPLLCMAPVANVRSLHRTFVDNIASTVEWSGFITKLNGQLQNFNLLGTVLLGANVGFLAIQSVDSGNGRSMTQIASYTSLVFSFGSIALGLTFIGLNLTGRERRSEAANFLRRMSDERHGLEKLAIIYSLPFAFLMWSMFLFLLAFSVEWCKPGDFVSRVIVGSVLVVVGGVIFWCIHVAQDRKARWWWEPDPRFSPREKRPSLAQRLLTRVPAWSHPWSWHTHMPKITSSHPLGNELPRANDTGATLTAVDLMVPIVTLQKPTNDVSKISLNSATRQDY
ncbi:hypothetical protein SCLCIDRAFT_101274 [Scleroderma citrinum Foug A]|uniref:WW domain-containing protein n=1 Tax=Scleroderma citrinum Foug A TaxID=1036808 RepID=A0A0C3EDB0_9AGAM|nr:hypothetical protein SCLCIDRAFT_101274 [Scleroderma citrinum Foug A]